MFHEERAIATFIKEHCPKIEVTTINGRYLVKVGGNVIDVLECGDVTGFKLMQGFLKRKQQQGYVSNYVIPQITSDNSYEYVTA